MKFDADDGNVLVFGYSYKYYIGIPLIMDMLLFFSCFPINK